MPLDRIRRLRIKIAKASTELENEIAIAYAQGIHQVDDIAAAAGMSRQNVYNVVNRRKKRK